MPDQMAKRRSVVDGLVLPSRPDAVFVSEAGPATRFLFRGNPVLIGSTFGIELPTVPMRAQADGARAALWLGPDEWLLLGPEADGPSLGVALSDALRGQPVSLVDVGHRQIGLVVTGPRADLLLNAGCPLNLDPAAFPVGMCTRTILAKAEIVLWRTADDTFRLEVARSFAPYVVAFLAEALHGIA